MFQPDLAIQTVKNALSSLSLADGPPLDYPEGPIAYALGLSLDGNAPVAPLAEALQEGNLAIEELDHAQVPTLKVNNIGPEPVYVALGAAHTQRLCRRRRCRRSCRRIRSRSHLGLDW